MHKGYKCLDRSTGRIYISGDVIFDESVFPFATPGVTVDVSTLNEAKSFPSTEPATSAHVRNYDLTYLATNTSGLASSFPVQDFPRLDTVDTPLDVHGSAASQAGSPSTHAGSAPPGAAAGSSLAREPASPAPTCASPARQPASPAPGALVGP